MVTLKWGALGLGCDDIGSVALILLDSILYLEIPMEWSELSH
jgi:hypothetical protein